jgi:hypothetical protein
VSKNERDDSLWDNRQLGASEEHAAVATPELEDQIDAALGLEKTELRLTLEVVASFKTLASRLGIGYRPLMRLALAQYIEAHGLPTQPAQEPAGAPLNCS